MHPEQGTRCAVGNLHPSWQAPRHATNRHPLAEARTGPTTARGRNATNTGVNRMNRLTTTSQDTKMTHKHMHISAPGSIALHDSLVWNATGTVAQISLQGSTHTSVQHWTTSTAPTDSATRTPHGQLQR